MSVLCFDLQYSIAAILDKNAELLSDTVQCPVDLIKKKIKISLNQQKFLFCSKKKIFDVSPVLKCGWAADAVHPGSRLCRSVFIHFIFLASQKILNFYLP